MTGKSYCHWCGKLVQNSDIVIDKDKNGYVVWAGCKDCNDNRPRG